MNQQINTIGKMGEFIPVSERWMHKSETKKKIEDALQWAEANMPGNKASMVAPALHRASGTD